MKKLLYKSRQGIYFFQIKKGTFSVIQVQSKHGSKFHTLQEYRFLDADNLYKSPYLSWQNLNCCGGWTADTEYLQYAVQKGKKLYAGFSRFINPDYSNVNLNDAKAELETLKKTLPNYCVAGEEIQHNKNFYNYYICRTGSLKDYFDLTQVLNNYKKLGVFLSNADYQQIKYNCEIEIKEFGQEKPFFYANAMTNSELITTGLLLGYPMESTAGLITDY